MRQPRARLFGRYASIWAVENVNSGRPDRYEVLLLTSSRPLHIGRELDMPYIKGRLIPRWETALQAVEFDGSFSKARQAQRLVAENTQTRNSGERRRGSHGNASE